mmetsp:Transcript_8922/g.22264  ORF Transcript_8922/g.22264 Transcript_8922/m.22264 type:complete len:128 (+) Transcript_8922:182-565(+)
MNHTYYLLVQAHNPKKTDYVHTPPLPAAARTKTPHISKKMRMSRELDHQRCIQIITPVAVEFEVLNLVFLSLQVIAGEFIRPQLVVFTVRKPGQSRMSIECAHIDMSMSILSGRNCQACTDAQFFGH